MVTKHDPKFDHVIKYFVSQVSLMGSYHLEEQRILEEGFFGLWKKDNESLPKLGRDTRDI